MSNISFGNSMKYIITLTLAIVFVFSACSKQSQENKPQDNAIKTVSFDELFSNKYDNKNVKVAIEGLCVHVCKHSGKKIFIIGSDPNNKFQVFAG